MSSVSIFGRFKQFSSLVLTFLSVVAVLIGIWNGWNLADFGGVPIEYLALFLTLLLLSVNEGYQVAIITSREYGIDVLRRWPRARAIRKLIFSEKSGEYDRLPRLFLGQSFMVVFSTYMISALTVFDKWPAGPLKILCSAGLPGILLTVNLAQLLPSIWATKHPLQYLTRAPAVQSTVSTALFIESLGLLHFTFVAVSFLEWAVVPKDLVKAQGAGNFGSHPSKFTEEEVAKDSSDDEISITFEASDHQPYEEYLSEDGGEAAPPGSLRAAGGDGGSSSDESSSNSSKFKAKQIFSTLIQCACVIYLVRNLFSGRSIVPLHPVLLLLIIIGVYYIVFLCEGLKIAIVSIAHLSREELLAKEYSADVYDILTMGGSEWLSRSRTASGTGARTFFFTRKKSFTKAEAAAVEINSVESSFGAANGELEEAARAHEHGAGKGKGVDISRFLLGRQMIVVPANFLIASIFTFNLEKMGPFWTTICVNLALPGVICTLQFVQLAPQVLAGRYPGTFLQLPGAKALVLAALAIQNLGLTETAFLLCDYLRPEATWTELLFPCGFPSCSVSAAACLNAVHEWYYNIGVETPAPTGERSKKFPEDVEDTANAASVALYIGSPNTSQRSTDVSERSDNDYVAVENPISRSVAV